MPDHIQRSKVFTIVNTAVLALLSLCCVLPLVHILAVALSGKAPATANLVFLWPIDFTFDAFKDTLLNDNFSRSLLISLQRTVIGTVVTMVVAAMTAYPLSKESRAFKGRGMYAWFFVFTMLFSGGLVPTYIVVTKLGLNNSLWALILPSAVEVWSIILLLNFFRNIPKELEEASLIDGSGHFTTMFRIFIPLSLPAIATLSLFTMVFHWNEWFQGMLYNTNSQNYPLATLLQTIVVQQDFTKLAVNPEDMEDITNRTVKAAQIFIGALPILMVYPFLQRYFVKGIVLGAVKE
ncbi:carbohydrate ABC transporter permease [Paenibacillus silvisoli]|uniref:carbohydrate ABC transporter permease n=1 Tax=Paenibacillus silvisoli TaxID=3110539 RepID=UPI002805CF73|nr:carbohydrate ABC transporter permease [Paenibacillus silvisoli]